MGQRSGWGRSPFTVWDAATHGAGQGASIDWPATLLAKQKRALRAEHLHYQRRPAAAQALHVFALDSSASMVRSGAFAQAKGLLLQWLCWAYLQRQPVAVLCFGAGQVQWHLLPRRAAQWNAGLIEPLQGGGGTPLQQAVHSAWALLGKRPEAERYLWLLSDFRSADVLALEREAPPSGVQHVLYNAEGMAAAHQRKRVFGGAGRLAKAWGGACVVLAA